MVEQPNSSIRSNAAREIKDFNLVDFYTLLPSMNSNNCRSLQEEEEGSARKCIPSDKTRRTSMQEVEMRQG